MDLVSRVPSINEHQDCLLGGGGQSTAPMESLVPLAAGKSLETPLPEKIEGILRTAPDAGNVWQLKEETEKGAQEIHGCTLPPSLYPKQPGRHFSTSGKWTLTV